MLRSEVAQGLVRTDGVVDVLPALQLLIELGEGRASVGCDFVELLVVGAVGPLDAAIQLRRATRQHEQTNLTQLTGLFEIGGELAAAIDLQSAHRERHALQQVVEELRGGERGGTREHRDDVPAANRVAGAEVMPEHPAGWAHLFGIDLHQIAGMCDAPVLGLAFGPWTAAQPASCYCAGNAAPGWLV